MIFGHQKEVYKDIYVLYHSLGSTGLEVSGCIAGPENWVKAPDCGLVVYEFLLLCCSQLISYIRVLTFSV